ncbi:sensor histidine kinase [Anaerotruncus colihominis]|uniref:histidine kinase n=1 Tax=Anaerotruncus colihominis TaxID=169435 RepID=A0A845SUE6_9FIRM|nr:HAMP domain-containing sensor histidine kinase [Anaerotruncus colihominis]MCR2024755.1 HAMP domain-containing histidine kinase [Anaerotruncus colihominis]NDO38183.1 HAMP domain-containing histidine kinase [Anaerotruncus colihominis]
MIQGKERIKTAAGVILFLILTATAFWICYQADNKYTANLPVLQDGTAFFSSDFGDCAFFLTDGWELYPDLLLTPDELAGGGYKPVRVRIGQYPSLSAFHSDASPHGEATYRIRLKVKDTRQQILVFPEVFSAYRVYLNGKLILQTGDVAPYRPRIQARMVTLPIEDEIEIVVQTVNRTHYYSGIYYPPAVGSLDAVNRMLFVRGSVYGVFALFSLSLALFSLAVWAGSRKEPSSRLYRWLGMLALSFSLRSCHVFFSAAGFSQIRAVYFLEDVAAFFNILCILKITAYLTGTADTWQSRFFCRVGVHAVLAGAVFPLLILPALPAFVSVYGSLVFWYKLGASLAALGMVLWQKNAGKDFIWLLAAVEIHATSLIARMFTLQSYEPAYAAWPDEYGAFILVLCFAVVMVRQSIRMAKENKYLRYNLQQEVAEKTRSLNLVLENRKQFLAGAAHDLKAPITLLQLYTQAIKKSGVGLDEETADYLKMIQRKSSEMQERLGELQTFAYEDARPLQMEPVDLREIVEAFYKRNLPDVEASGIDLILQLPEKPCMIQADRERLDRVLQNLVYNALSFVSIGGKITISLITQNKWAVLKISDNGMGIPAENLPRIFDRFFSTRSGDGGSGYGLYLAKSFVLEHAGDISAESEYGNGSVFTVRLPLFFQTNGVLNQP